MDGDPIQSVLIIGAGTMGEGIAQNFAQAGLDVLVVDTASNALARSMHQIEANLLQMRHVDVIRENPEQIISRISTWAIENTDAIMIRIDGFDFVVEAVPEKLELKRALFLKLDRCRRDIVLSTNTSSLTVSEITEGMRTPERVVGLHYFYPAHIVPLVEIHGGKQTSAGTISTTRELMLRVGKQPIVVRKEIPGLIVNRIQAAYNREVTYLLNEGIATAEELDLAAKAGFGFRLACLGPLEIHDLNGLDVVLHAGGKTRQSICNDRTSSPLLVEKVSKGELGVKTGKGWHDYKGKSREEILERSNHKLLKQLALFQSLEKEAK